jgi:hypothetical protein
MKISQSLLGKLVFSNQSTNWQTVNFCRQSNCLLKATGKDMARSVESTYVLGEGSTSWLSQKGTFSRRLSQSKLAVLSWLHLHNSSISKRKGACFSSHAFSVSGSFKFLQKLQESLFLLSNFFSDYILRGNFSLFLWSNFLGRKTVVRERLAAFFKQTQLDYYLWGYLIWYLILSIFFR